uniref:Major sperm protein n=1 Tax=Ascaris lumbricoides TaxID=6252 RepID=A0A0M3IJV5_ASCLU
LYWSVHGLLICFDNAFGDLFGYFLAKFVLLCTLLVYAIQKSTIIVQLRQAATTLINDAEPSEKIANQSTSGSLITMRSTIASFPHNESSMMTALSDSSLATPMKTISKSAGHSTTKTICDLLNEDFKAGDHKHALASASIISAATADASTCIEQSKFEPSSALNGQGDQITFKSPFTDSTTITITNAHNKPIMWALKTNALKRLAAQPTCGVLPSYATIHVLVKNEGDNERSGTNKEAIIITFKSPFTDSTTITITNAHNKPIMWALKTNALKRLAAQPTCGVLPSYATIHVCLLESPPSDMLSVDRMAIDYCITEEGTALFDRGFMHRKDNDRRRKNISVVYFN